MLLNNYILALLMIFATLCSCGSSKSTNMVTSQVDFDGIDVSRHQGEISWKHVAKEDRVKFVYIKATEGGTYQDPRYEKNLKKARKQGLMVGSYHFLRTTSSIWLQFLNIMSHVEKSKQDLVPMIDVEECKNWSSQQLRDSLSLMVRLLENEYGKKPIIYTGQNFYKKRMGDRFIDCPLWIARYGDVEPDINAPYSIWQFTQSGKLKGVNGAIDLNRIARNQWNKILLH